MYKTHIRNSCLKVVSFFILLVFTGCLQFTLPVRSQNLSPVKEAPFVQWFLKHNSSVSFSDAWSVQISATQAFTCILNDFGVSVIRFKFFYISLSERNPFYLLSTINAP